MSSTNPSDGSKAYHDVKGHKDLPDVLAPLLEAEDVLSNKPHLIALETHLVAHFKEEEQPGGWFDELREMEPGCATKLDELRSEHGEILGQLQELIGRVSVLQGHLVLLQAEKEKLLDLLQRHSETEHKLALDTYFVDTGGGA